MMHFEFDCIVDVMNMNQDHISTISTELQLQDQQVRAVASLLETGCTVPFIARYRARKAKG